MSDLKGDAQSGPVRQREAITRKYAELGVSPEDITWAEDLDVSAFHVPPHKRPMLRRAFNALPPGSNVVFYRLDRFVRRVFPDFSDMISFAAHRRLNVHSATEKLDLSGAVGMMMATMIAFMAQMESESMSARVKNTHEYFRKVGRWKGALRPYGYRPTRVDGKPGWYLEQDPETALLLREAVKRVLQGHSVNAVATWLNDKGALPPIDRARVLQGKPRLCQCGHDEHDPPCEKIHKCHHRKRVSGKNLKLHEYDECSQPCLEYQPRVWRRESLDEIMRSPAICGYTVENGNQIVRNDKEMAVEFAPGIIDFDTFQQLQARLDERKYTKVRTATESLLLNVAYCDDVPLYSARKVRKLKTAPKVFEYYRHASKHDCPGGGSWGIPADALDRLVERELLKTLGDCEVLRLETGSEQRTEIQVELHEVSSQIVALTQEMYLRGKPRENHNKLMAGLQARHAKLTEALESHHVPETAWVPTGETFRDRWESMDTVERRLWLLDAGVRVDARRGRMPPVKFASLPRLKRSLIAASDGDVYANIYLGNLGEILRRAEQP